MSLLYTILVTFFAGMGAGLGTGFAGMSAAAVISPMLITFLVSRSFIDDPFSGYPDPASVKLPAKPVHVPAEPDEPVLRVAVVGGVPAGVSLLVAYHVLRLDSRIVLHQPFAEVGGKPERRLKVSAVVQSVLRYLYLYVSRIVVVAPF